MKKKEAISPPSKTGISDREGLREKVVEKRKQFTALAQEIETLEDELYYGEEYTRILPQAAELALTNKRDLDATYKNNKGELVQLFNSAITNQQNAKKHVMGASLFGLLTLGTAIGSIVVDPALLMLTMMTGVGSVTGFLDGVQSKSAKRQNIQKIQDQVISHHKQLPYSK